MARTSDDTITALAWVDDSIVLDLAADPTTPNVCLPPMSLDLVDGRDLAGCFLILLARPVSIARQQDRLVKEARERLDIECFSGRPCSFTLPASLVQSISEYRRYVRSNNEPPVAATMRESDPSWSSLDRRW